MTNENRGFGSHIFSFSQPNQQSKEKIVSQLNNNLHHPFTPTQIVACADSETVFAVSFVERETLRRNYKNFELHWVTNYCGNRKLLTQIYRAFNFETRAVGALIDFETVDIDLYTKTFLILDEQLVVGGGSFYLHQYEEAVWCFQWLWLHPAYRRLSIYKSLHIYLRKKFGRFYAEPPLSREMSSFLRKHDIELWNIAQSNHKMGDCSKCRLPVMTNELHVPTGVATSLKYQHLDCQPKT